MSRPNQKQRTRKDLLDAAARLTRQGLSPSLEEVAAEALVSRATAYRYFPSVEALLVEAAVHVVTPTAAEIFAKAPPTDPVARAQAVEAALARLTHDNEAALRAMLAHSVQHAGGDLPARQNRRTPMLQEALEPARDRIDPALYDTLVQALGVLVGIEAVVALKDVMQVDDKRACQVKQWAVAALVQAALKP